MKQQREALRGMYCRLPYVLRGAVRSPAVPRRLQEGAR